LRAAFVSLALMLFLAAGCGAGDTDKGVGGAAPNASARSGEAIGERSADNRPNIVFIMTDDMEEKMLARMPVVRLRMVDEGVTFDNAFVTKSLCCPSRVTTLRGQ
jgi:N-acetylglucosamine-6-sulfatase